MNSKVLLVVACALCDSCFRPLLLILFAVFNYATFIRRCRSHYCQLEYVVCRASYKVRDKLLRSAWRTKAIYFQVEVDAAFYVRQFLWGSPVAHGTRCVPPVAGDNKTSIIVFTRLEHGVASWTTEAWIILKQLSPPFIFFFANSLSLITLLSTTSLSLAPMLLRSW